MILFTVQFFEFYQKLAEHFDVAIYNITGQLMAGHLLSAVGLWLFLVYLQKRQNRQ